MKKIIFILVATVMVVTTGMVSGCTGAEKPATSPEKVTLGISTGSVFSTMVLIANEKGYFLEEGIELETRDYPTGAANMAAMFNGELDISAGAAQSIILESFERNDFAIWATIVGSSNHNKVLARKDRNINTAQDLAGKKVAVTKGTSAHYFMDLYLLFNGLDASDVEIVDLKPNEMVEAIVNGDVDAIFSWEPNIYYAQKSLGDKAVILPYPLGYLVVYNLVSKKDFIENNPELLGKMVKALLKAEEFIRDNREESIDMIASSLKMDNNDLSQLWDFYKFRLSLSQTLVVALEDEARWAIRNNLTDKTKVPNYLDFVHLDALKELKPEAVTIVR